MLSNFGLVGVEIEIFFIVINVILLGASVLFFVYRWRFVFLMMIKIEDVIIIDALQLYLMSRQMSIDGWLKNEFWVETEEISRELYRENNKAFISFSSKLFPALRYYMKVSFPEMYFKIESKCIIVCLWNGIVVLFVNIKQLKKMSSANKCTTFNKLFKWIKALFKHC